MIARAATSRVAVILAAALLGGALAWWITSSPPTEAQGGADSSSAAPQWTSAAPSSPRTGRPATSPPPRPARPVGRSRPAGGFSDGVPEPSAPRPAPPQQLRIPSLNLRLPVRPEGVDPAGAMGLPDTVTAAGWYRYGPRPGSAAGSAVIAGHVDTKEEGIGPLADLADVEVGARVRVDTARGAVEYIVTSVDTVSQQELDLSLLFAREGSPVLNVVTCGGAYLPDAGGYQSNVVVAAEPSARGVAGSEPAAITSAR